ncbi:hypothetical protein M758_2G036100 [Ceratodon purpureus]|uniref:Uncharacterized protein n=2 Tax=Ceratodon purpureus TaxID=3225 RepID=A0A8T0I062_CERPU|nr:hypothetical protein KC19_5G109000 [Ceratodon purpureus]KAG0576805.1 hypothetical protein KC19_5G109000 [Ceratodon purpureus]KAG0625204.1 hypothetical protein M758_2G036100 [Ceratodon purpureus]
MFDFGAGEPVAQRSMIFGGFPAQVRYMSSDLSALPDIKDGGILKALHALLGANWTKVEPSVRDAVEASLKISSDDVVGKEALTDAWRAAEAVEKFGGNMLQELLLEITDLSGGTGEDVKPIPDSTYNAVEAAYKKYIAYLDSFEEDEAYLKKKVENELGGLFLQIKQRLAGMDPKWSKITLLGTSGLSGSYIERRALV